MKLIVASLVILLAGCGKESGGGSSSSIQASKFGAGGPCSNSPALGAWKSLVTGEIIEFTSSCRYNNVYCKSEGSFPSTDVTQEEGTIKITVDIKASNTPQACLPIGEHTCNYKINSQYSSPLLYVSCGGVNGAYQKIQGADSWGVQTLTNNISENNFLGKPIVDAALTENHCLIGTKNIIEGERKVSSFPLNINSVPEGDLYIGVTSYGDVAVVIGKGESKNPLFVSYICPRSELSQNFEVKGIGALSLFTSPSPKCGEVVKSMNVNIGLPANLGLGFRWLDGGTSQGKKFSFCKD